MSKLRVLCGNLEVNRVSHYTTGTKQGGEAEDNASHQQLQAIADLAPDLLLLQEHSSRLTDDYCRNGWPHVADHTIRFLAHPSFNCRQVLAVHANMLYPIDDRNGKDLGFLHPDGKEHVPELMSLGRQVRAAALAASVALHDGTRLWAITTHGPWVQRADAGEFSAHQLEYFYNLSVFLNFLKYHSPAKIVLSGDFNARMVDIMEAKLLPDWLTLVTPTTGLSLDLPPDHAKAQFLTERNLYVDGVFTYGIEALNFEVITGLSDHKLHLVELDAETISP